MPKRASDPAPRVLLFYSNTGGGHRAAAEALRDEFQRRYPHVTVVMEDFLLRYTFWPLSESDRFYFWAVEQWPGFWRWLYTVTSLPRVYLTIIRVLQWVLIPRVKRLYKTHAPVLIVSLHPLLNHLPRRALHAWHKEHHLSPRPPFATVITDLTTFHPSWVDPEVDLLVVGTQEACSRACQLGMPPEKVQILGLPVRPGFKNLPRDKGALRRHLGLDPDKPVVLLMSGGQGMGPVERIAREIANQVDVQLVIVTGRNGQLQRRLQDMAWSIPVRVLGFVEDIHLWMAASDVLVTKAGPGTIAEALISGLPILLYGYIPGQEEGNVRFVEQHNIGLYIPDPRRLAHTLAQWLQNPEQHVIPRSERARALGFPQATEQIVDTLIGLIPAETRPQPAWAPPD